jgi:tripartite-type tricarboxylate transporter receptor subunit TctC
MIRREWVRCHSGARAPARLRASSTRYGASPESRRKFRRCFWIPDRPFGASGMTAATALVLIFSAPAAQADAVADFYRGKTVNVLIGVAVGGEYDLHARLVARHIGRHIPGNPAVVAQNMTGAGGLRMTNYLYSVAPRDGTMIGMVANAFPSLQAVGHSGVQFDAGKMSWLGTIAPVVETMAVWHTSAVKSIDDARQREISVGATARGAITYFYPALMNDVLGTKFKIVTGYPGGNDINLAMERGEVEARNNTWSSWKVTRSAWLAEKKIIIIAQAGPRAKDLDAPSLEDAARTPEDRQFMELVLSGTQFGRPLTTNAGVPAERVTALRAAFAATMKDPQFLAEAKQLNIEVEPVLGEAMQKIVEKVLATPKPIAARAKVLLE